MKFVSLPTREVAGAAAQIIREIARLDPTAAIAIPTGRTPLALYRHLVGEVQAGDDSLCDIQWFALDEFCGPDIPIEARFRTFLLDRFILPAGLNPNNLHAMDGACGDPMMEAQRYEDEIAAHGGLTLAILGIGTNGHIAFNEPGTPLTLRTGVRRLTETTVAANRYLFPKGSSRPSVALTMGPGTLLEASRGLLLATGSGKKDIIARLKNTPPTPDLPASVLHLHPDCTVITDF